MIHIIQPSCLNSTPAIPVTIVNGKNTASIVSVDATTDTATSFVPCTAALLGLEPRSMCVVTFSSTTMASSTTLPIAILKQDNEIVLSEPSVIRRYMNDAISENGIVIPMMTVALQRPRNMNTTSITNSKAYAIVSPSVATVCLMLSDVSTIIPSSTSEGSLFCSFGSSARTASAMATELPPDCFCIMIIAPCWPFVNAFCARSCVLSTKRAISLR